MEAEVDAEMDTEVDAEVDADVNAEVNAEVGAEVMRKWMQKLMQKCMRKWTPHQTCQTKITNLRHSIFIKKDICWLQIAMNELVAMDVRHSFTHTHRDTAGV